MIETRIHARDAVPSVNRLTQRLSGVESPRCARASGGAWIGMRVAHRIGDARGSGACGVVHLLPGRGRGVLGLLKVGLVLRSTATT